MLNHQTVFCIARNPDSLPYKLFFLQNNKLHINLRNEIILVDSILLHIFFQVLY